MTFTDFNCKIADEAKRAGPQIDFFQFKRVPLKNKGC